MAPKADMAFTVEAEMEDHHEQGLLGPTGEAATNWRSGLGSRKNEKMCLQFRIC